MNINWVRASLLGGTALLAIAGAPAFAADTKPADTNAAADPADDAGQLKEIVVTATKRETSLQKTPIAISVIDPTVLKDRHVQSLHASRR